MKKFMMLILTAVFVFNTVNATVYAMPREAREIMTDEEYEEYMDKLRGDNDNDNDDDDDNYDDDDDDNDDD
jgi:hypothetical protein